MKIISHISQGHKTRSNKNGNTNNNLQQRNVNPPERYGNEIPKIQENSKTNVMTAVTSPLT